MSDERPESVRVAVRALNLDGDLPGVPGDDTAIQTRPLGYGTVYLDAPATALGLDGDACEALLDCQREAVEAAPDGEHDAIEERIAERDIDLDDGPMARLLAADHVTVMDVTSGQSREMDATERGR